MIARIVLALFLLFTGSVAGNAAPKIFVWVATGDSITASGITWFFQFLNTTHTGDASKPTIQSAQTYYSGNIVAQNMSISGTKLAGNAFDLTALAPVYADPVSAVKQIAHNGGLVTSANHVLIFSDSIGSNDGAIANYSTVAQYAAANALQCRLRKTAGYDLCVMSTLLPRSDGVMDETNRLAYNALLQSPSWRVSNGVDYIFDFAAQPQMGDVSNNTNPIYYNPDKVHPTAYGQSLIVPYAASTMATIMALYP